MMRCFYAVVAAVALVSGRGVAAQSQAELEKAAIEKIALDYIEGWFEGNTERMERALHPDLAKRTFQVDPASGQPVLQNLTKTMMVEYTQKGGGKGVPAEKRGIKVAVLDQFRDIATVRVESVSFIDYLQLAKAGNRWQIVNVLWTQNRKDRKVVTVDPKLYGNYVGEYELAPQFILAITTDAGRIFAQATGQPKVEIFPETEVDYFLTVTDAQITFVKDAEGRVNQLVLHQGGRDVPAKKIR
jgi:hypothetical protein